MRKILSAFAIVGSFTVPAFASEKVVVEFGYPYSHLFDVTYKAMMPAFKKKHPNIEIKFRATYENYEDATETILREAQAGTLPDVTMQGLNRQAQLVETGIAKSLEPFITKETNFAKDGYHQAMLDLSTFDNQVYGLPFSVSLPVGFYNMDLLQKGGVHKMPETWNEVSEMCKTMRSNGVKTPVFWAWNITGNWFWQALMWSQGKAPVEKNGKMNLDNKETTVALETMDKIFHDCAMPDYGYKQALTAFQAGEVAMMFTSTSAVGAVERGKGDFTFKTGRFPGIDGVNGGKPMGLPAGGNAAMMVSTSKDPKVVAAAWTWLKFITSGEGAAEVAKTTGYVPPNKAANDLLLQGFYTQNPNKKTAVDQLPLLRDWLSYPGKNKLAITQVIYDGMHKLVTDEATVTESQVEMVEEVNDLLN